MKLPGNIGSWCLLLEICAVSVTIGSEIREDSVIRQFAGNIGPLPVQNIHPAPLTWDAAASTAAQQILGIDHRKRLVAMGYQSPVEFALHIAIHPNQTDLIPWFSVSLQLSERLGLTGRYAYRTYAELVEYRTFIHLVASMHPLDITIMPPGSRFEIQNLDRGLQAYHALRSLFPIGQEDTGLAVRFTEEMANQEALVQGETNPGELDRPATLPTEAAFVWCLVPVIGEDSSVVDWITLEETLGISRRGNLLSPVAMAYAELFDSMKSNLPSETLRHLKTMLDIPVIRGLVRDPKPPAEPALQIPTLIPGVLAAGLSLFALGVMPWVWKRRHRWVQTVEILLMIALAFKLLWLMLSGLGAASGWFWQAGALVHGWGLCMWMNRREPDLRLRLPGMMLTALPILLAWPQVQPEVVHWTVQHYPVLWLTALAGWMIGIIMLVGVSLYFLMFRGMKMIELHSPRRDQKKNQRSKECVREPLEPLRWILSLTLLTTGAGLLLLQISRGHPAGWVFPIACLLVCAFASAFLLQLAWIRMLTPGMMARGLLCTVIFAVALMTTPVPIAESWLPPRFLSPDYARWGYQWLLVSVFTWAMAELLIWGWQAGLRWNHRPRKSASQKPTRTVNKQASTPGRPR